MDWNRESSIHFKGGYSWQEKPVDGPAPLYSKESARVSV